MHQQVQGKLSQQGAWVEWCKSFGAGAGWLVWLPPWCLLGDAGGFVCKKPLSWIPVLCPAGGWRAGCLMGGGCGVWGLRAGTSWRQGRLQAYASRGLVEGVRCGRLGGPLTHADCVAVKVEGEECGVGCVLCRCMQTALPRVPGGDGGMYAACGCRLLGRQERYKPHCALWGALVSPLILFWSSRLRFDSLSISMNLMSTGLPSSNMAALAWLVQVLCLALMGSALMGSAGCAGPAVHMAARRTKDIEAISSAAGAAAVPAAAKRKPAAKRKVAAVKKVWTAG